MPTVFGSKAGRQSSLSEQALQKRPGFTLGGVSALGIAVHFLQHGLDLRPQFRGEQHFLAAAGLAIEQRPGGNGATQHLFQAQGLAAELQAIGVVLA